MASRVLGIWENDFGFELMDFALKRVLSVSESTMKSKEVLLTSIPQKRCKELIMKKLKSEKILLIEHLHGNARLRPSLNCPALSQ